MKMIRQCLAVAALIGVALGVAPARSQEGGTQRLSEKAEQLFGQLREEAGNVANQIREGFEEARALVDRLGVVGRVYARLRWDKALQGASITVDVDSQGAATLRGTVATEASKSKASRLTEDTVGVQRVANYLVVVPPPGS